MTVNFDHARDDEQRRRMQRALDTGECLLCRENIERYHDRPILLEGAYWLVTENAFPYEGATLHHLVVYTRGHETDFRAIPPEAWTELQALLSSVADTHGVSGGSLVMRFGDTKITGATLAHLHAHLIVGEPFADKRNESLRVKVGYKKASG